MLDHLCFNLYIQSQMKEVSHTHFCGNGAIYGVLAKWNCVLFLGLHSGVLPPMIFKQGYIFWQWKKEELLSSYIKLYNCILKQC